MLYIVQVLSSGIFEAPKLYLDEETAKAAYVELTKGYWPLTYPEYCSLNGCSPEAFSSAEAFGKTFEVGDKNRIFYWQSEPEGVGSDKAADLKSPATKPVQEEPAPSDETQNAPGWEPFAGAAMGMGGSRPGESRFFPRSDWRQAVYCNETSLEYGEWFATKVDHCIEHAKKAGYAITADPARFGRFYFTTPTGEQSEVSFDNEDLAWCEAHQHSCERNDS